MRRPYFKKTHNCWYVTDPNTRREVRLDPSEEKSKEMWAAMIDAGSQISPSVTFSRLAEEFLSANYEDKPQFHTKAKHIAAFAEHVGIKRATDVSKRDVHTFLDAPKPGQRRKDKKTGEWIDGEPIKWAQRTKKIAFTALTSVYRWGISEGHITKNPMARIKVADGKPRATTITPEQFAQLVAASDIAFRLYLLACSAGCRPRQVREVEAKHVLPDFSAWIFESHKTAEKTGKPLVVYLQPCLQTLTRILAAARPTGPLFLNSEGRPWKKDTVVHKMARLRDKLGLPDGVINYSLRHTFATQALLGGNSLQTVAELLGHTDARMVSRVYGHLDQHSQFLAKAAMGINIKKSH